MKKTRKKWGRWKTIFRVVCAHERCELFESLCTDGNRLQFGHCWLCDAVTIRPDWLHRTICADCCNHHEFDGCSLSGRWQTPAVSLRAAGSHYLWLPLLLAYSMPYRIIGGGFIETDAGHIEAPHPQGARYAWTIWGIHVHRCSTQYAILIICNADSFFYLFDGHGEH